jgi:two-component system, response regulator
MNEKTILLVEDNPDDVELTLRAFKKNKMKNNIVIVGDGQEALDYLFCKEKFEGRNSSDLPSMVLLDLNLPKLDGFEVLKAIRKAEKTKFLPVIILTSSNEERDIVYGYLMGANSFIQKPVDFKNFSEAIKTITVFWTHINKTPDNFKDHED